MPGIWGCRRYPTVPTIHVGTFLIGAQQGMMRWRPVSIHQRTPSHPGYVRAFLLEESKESCLVEYREWQNAPCSASAGDSVGSKGSWNVRSLTCVKGSESVAPSATRCCTWSGRFSTGAVMPAPRAATTNLARCQGLPSAAQERASVICMCVQHTSS